MSSWLRRLHLQLRLTLPLAIAPALLFAGGCKDKEPTVEAAEADDADRGSSESDSKPAAVYKGGEITEQHGDTAVTWLVGPDGDVTATVQHKGETVKPSDVDAKLLVKPLGTNEPSKEIPLIEKDGALRANIGKLDAPLTEMRYAMKVKDEPVDGVLHVPKDGTEELVASAIGAAKAKHMADAKGPHGGVVQVVGDDVVEVVGRRGSGDVRVYLLDDDLKPVKIEKQKIKLAVVGAATDYVVLQPHDSGDYFSAELALKTDPTKITILIEDGDDVEVALVGYEPTEVILVGPGSPGCVIYVVDTWDIVVVHPQPVYVHRHKGKGKGKGHGKKWKRKKGGVEVHVHH